MVVAKWVQMAWLCKKVVAFWVKVAKLWGRAVEKWVRMARGRVVGREWATRCNMGDSGGERCPL
jgi:hypothetical protein